MEQGISVVIPAHPARVRSGMLDRAVQSATAQTLMPRSVICEMDQERKGAPAVRTAGLMKATTRWVAFLDSDDLFLPNHLETLWTVARESGADYVFSWFDPVKYRNGRQVGRWVDPLGHFGKEFDPAQPHQTTITILVRTELAQSIGFRPVPAAQVPPPGGDVSGEDWYFTTEAIKAGAKIVHIPQRTWQWVLHEGNTSGLPTRGDAKRR